MSDMDNYRDMFLAESADYIQQMTDGLLALEHAPDDIEPVELVFRGSHSLKGMSAAMQYDRTADLTHKMESLMDRVRKGERRADRSLVELMLAAVDLVKDLIDDESSGNTAVDASEMIAALEEMKDAAEPASPESETGLLIAGAQSGGTHELKPGEGSWVLDVTLEEGCVLKAVRAYMVLKRLSHIGTVVDTTPSVREIEDENFDLQFRAVMATTATEEQLREAVMHVMDVADVDIAPIARPEATPHDAPKPTAHQVERRRRDLPKLSETQTVRVSIGHLDALVDLVGELVILRSRLDRLGASRQDPELTETLDDLQRISTDLQYEVMQTRMVPVGNIFNRFPRMVRDLAVDLGKEVEFEMLGLDIELDRTVLDEIGDPLVHLLRNCIDHGIEDAASRTAAGKPAAGRVQLSASRERDHVAIIVSDDGNGMDPARIWTKACERMVVHPDERSSYSDSDILLLTCVPGFSTAEQTTKVSGRGVGMDVVKGKIEHLGGTIQIESVIGQGTRFILRLPFTLAILHALLVQAGEQQFALPLSAVEEVFLAEELLIDTIEGSPVAILRDGEVVQLHRLDALLLGADPKTPPTPRSSIVLVSSGSERRALHIDQLCGRQEIVIKPLSSVFRETKGFSGATILGDGRVMLIIDPRTIFSAMEA